ncbi:S-ribosylhomocysteine lyase /quorum-sensing autoinducer 2 (AI-2) synthesis protein LuxS [Marininema mesophilum]|uniref:S-ribosylhomocysteine lyase n=1 Tax=Marininema mesophilum TaxID=1048340 RepID=A0A1H2Q6Z7_9BACL|nr:S-ribosylhomocysteine lyase [Marininema mesophilum]SDW02790.1 S-ribosylhomocysteine lyase /quorum-sensing autoinducer 2 (AI-2) synthesis protein LuxS [Marininema mesophilum]
MKSEARFNVESFNLDHTLVAAPYVRTADVKELGRERIIKFDIRFTQPNEKFIPTDALHSLEHLLAENIRNHTDQVIDLSPMGCRTGFYLIMRGEITPEEAANYIRLALQDVVEATEVPGCSPIHCGNYRDHDLEGAQLWANRFLSIPADHLGKVFQEEFSPEELEQIPAWTGYEN